MGRPRQTLCRNGLHELDDPTNVYITWDKIRAEYKRHCRLCALERKRRLYRSLPPTPAQVSYLQAIADGFSIEEASERMRVTPSTVKQALADVRSKYGAPNRAAAVAYALARGEIQPDYATGATLPGSNAVRHHLASICVLVRGKRRPLHGVELQQELDALMSWSEPHAVSVLWAAGRLTAQDVPSVPLPKPREDAATWKATTMDGA